VIGAIGYKKNRKKVMLKYLTPLFLFVILAVFLAIGLKLNPKDIPSPLIGRPVPDFSLPLLHLPEKKLGSSNLKGRVWLLNVWASWCVSCRAEHPLLNQLAKKETVTIIGLNYKDDPENAKRWLKMLGNPYNASVMDQDGRIGIDFGVYGVPETFVIDKKGIIRHKHTGPLTMDDISGVLGDMIKELQNEEI
jgi:cytochrome c biogenesis protein CcmG/thiol:disulfide interchange protein DsbE